MTTTRLMSTYYVPATEPPTVALVIDPDTGLVHDQCYTWETGQTYALDGWQVLAIRSNGSMTVEAAQRLATRGDVAAALK